jgi:HK97 family phage portal protein
VTALYLLPPDKMQVTRDKKGELTYTLDPGGDPTVFRREEILHIPGLGFDGLVGDSPIAMARNALGMALATDEYGAVFFGNGATPGGILEYSGTIKDPKKLKDDWNAAHQGSRNAHRVVVLEQGMKYHPVTIPPEQAQFLQTRKFHIEEICRIFRVPPHLVADLERAQCQQAKLGEKGS